MAVNDASKHASQDLSGSVYLISSDGSILSLPIPSKFPADPLNWSSRRRVSAFISIVFFSAVSMIEIQGPSLLYRQLSLDFGEKETHPFTIEALVPSPTLFLGIGAFLWIPLSLAIGRRPVFLLCAITVVFATLWASLAQNFYSLLVALCLQGFAAAAATSVVLLMAIDLTYIHQRPRAIAMIWTLVGAISLSILSIVPEMMAGTSSWRHFYLIMLVPSIVAFLLVLLFFPETLFFRPAVAFDGRVLVQGGSEKVKIYDDWMDVPAEQQPETGSERLGWLRLWKVWGSSVGTWKAMLACYPQILLCFCNPLIFWVAILNALNFGGMLSIGMTFSSVLSTQPYSLPDSLVALVNLSAAAGSLIAYPTSGIMISYITRRLSIRNSGVREAEVYLAAFVLPVLTGAASVILYGFAAERKWHFMFIYISYALNAFSFASNAVANTLWITEAFPRWAAPALVVVGGGSYVISFGLTFAIIPWVQAEGYAKANVEIGAMILMVGIIAIPLAFRGKSLRQYIHGRWGEYGAGALRPQ